MAHPNQSSDRAQTGPGVSTTKVTPKKFTGYRHGSGNGTSGSGQPGADTKNRNYKA